jgi:hypothetical protein
MQCCLFAPYPNDDNIHNRSGRRWHWLPHRRGRQQRRSADHVGVHLKRRSRGLDHPGQAAERRGCGPAAPADLGLDLLGHDRASEGWPGSPRLGVATDVVGRAHQDLRSATPSRHAGVQPVQPFQACPAGDLLGRRLRPSRCRTGLSRTQRHPAMRRHRVISRPAACRQGWSILPQRHERPTRLEDACLLSLSPVRLLSH